MKTSGSFDCWYSTNLQKGLFHPFAGFVLAPGAGGALGMTIKGGDRFDHPSCPPPPLALSVRSLSGGEVDRPGGGAD